jgi:hypothetical protein
MCPGRDFGTLRAPGGNRSRLPVVWSGVATAFCFEFVFRAPSVAKLVSAYFDPGHLATQDALAKLGEREVVESSETDDVRKCTWRVASLAPLPMIAKPFVKGGRLYYLETMTWRRGEDAVDMSVVPDILNGRVSVTGAYELSKIGENQIRRVYRGEIAANIPLLSGKIERGILEAFHNSMAKMAGCTQTWLDHNP